jgi:alkane 1-monooxygenase
MLVWLPSLLAIAGNVWQHTWHWVHLVYVLVFLVLADWLLPNVRKQPEVRDSALWPDAVLVVATALHITAIVSLLYSCYTAQGIQLSHVVAAISTGLSSGVNGITVAHELIHRVQRRFRMAGIINLVLVCYGHFYVEHIKGHHKKVGTPDDPATARKGESLYAFQLRTIPQQWWSAYQIEKKKKSFLNNFVIQITLLELMLTGVLYSISSTAAAVFLIQSLVAVLLLEYVNYIEHYGLARHEQERVTARHSWQSDVLSSRFTLVNLSRHADHHFVASKPYHLLTSHETSPEMPSGYFGMFYIALLPPLWFRMVDPLIKQEPAHKRA